MPTPWPERIKSADRYYEKWANKYKCKQLEQYYRGFHWQGDIQPVSIPYTLNMVFSTVDIKLSTYSFSNIQYNVRPRPSKSDFNQEFATQVARLKSDALNTLTKNDNIPFDEEIEQALQDSFFRFGLIEIGYSANWVDNPNRGKPLYASDLDTQAEEDVVKEPDQIPESEMVYFKRIDPSRFRVGGIEGRYLPQCNWVGYYDYYYVADIKNDPSLRNTSEITTVSNRSEDWFNTEEFDELLKKGDLTRIWTIYDNRAGIKYMWDQSNDTMLKETPFKRLPLFDLRWARDVKGWYPIPPVFQWISPQDEINESRQGMRDYRRRFVSQFQVVEDFIDQEELDKFEEAKSGGIIKTKRPDAIQPIQNPSLSAVVKESMIIGKDDFVLISGASSEAFGVADRMTATQSLEISKRTQVRQGREQYKVANWLCRIGKEILKQAQEKLALGFWVKASADPGKESLLGEVQLNQEAWQYILSQDLDDGVDFDVDMEITSLSPVENDNEKRRFVEFLAIVMQFPQISMSPALIREAAYRVGYKNERVIKEMQNMSLLASMAQSAGAQPGMGGGQAPTGGQMAQQKVAQMSPNTTEEVQNQMNEQMMQ